jgi:hypothetical protein
MMLFLYATKKKKMNNEKQTIHEFDLNIIYDFFSDTERQGPGSPEETIKALRFLNGLTGSLKLPILGVEQVVRQWCWEKTLRVKLPVLTPGPVL